MDSGREEGYAGPVAGRKSDAHVHHADSVHAEGRGGDPGRTSAPRRGQADLRRGGGEDEGLLPGDRQVRRGGDRRSAGRRDHGEALAGHRVQGERPYRDRAGLRGGRVPEDREGPTRGEDQVAKPPIRSTTRRGTNRSGPVRVPPSRPVALRISARAMAVRSSRRPPKPRPGRASPQWSGAWKVMARSVVIAILPSRL